MPCSSITQPPVWYLEGLILKLVTSLIGKRNIYWVILTKQCLSSQLCLLEQISRLSGRWWRAAVWLARCSDVDVEVNSAAALSCHREYEYFATQENGTDCRFSRVLRLSVCVWTCVFSSHSIAEEMQAPKHKSMHCTCLFCLCFLHRFLLSVVFSLVSACSLYLNSTTTTYCSNLTRTTSSPTETGKTMHRWNEQKCSSWDLNCKSLLSWISCAFLFLHAADCSFSSVTHVL